MTVQTLFNDTIKPKVELGEEIFGTKLDPVWLFPIGPIKLKKKIFKSDLIGCNLHMHNLKTANLDKIEIQRDVNLTNIALRLRFHIPILWMTGNYMVKNGFFLKFIPVKMSGFFNVDLKNVNVDVILSMNLVDEKKVILDEFGIRTQWSATSIKYDTRWKHLDRIGDFVINKVSKCIFFRQNNFFEGNDWLRDFLTP